MLLYTHSLQPYQVNLTSSTINGSHSVSTVLKEHASDIRNTYNNMKNSIYSHLIITIIHLFIFAISPFMGYLSQHMIYVVTCSLTMLTVLWLRNIILQINKLHHQTEIASYENDSTVKTYEEVSNIMQEEGKRLQSLYNKNNIIPALKTLITIAQKSSILNISDINNVIKIIEQLNEISNSELNDLISSYDINDISMAIEKVPQGIHSIIGIIKNIDGFVNVNKVLKLIDILYAANMRFNNAQEILNQINSVIKISNIEYTLPSFLNYCNTMLTKENIDLTVEFKPLTAAIIDQVILATQSVLNSSVYLQGSLWQLYSSHSTSNTDIVQNNEYTYYFDDEGQISLSPTSIVKSFTLMGDRFFNLNNTLPRYDTYISYTELLQHLQYFVQLTKMLNSGRTLDYLKNLVALITFRKNVIPHLKYAISKASISKYQQMIEPSLRLYMLNALSIAP